MNIYLHVEISSRELDSKLLLASIAAARGHQVVICDMTSLMLGVNKRGFEPGVVHTKSLTPSEKKILRHSKIIEHGHMITSIDEESGLAEHVDYERFSRKRCSCDTLQQASAAFGWGRDDTRALKSVYPDYADRIFMTGSPRVDICLPRFRDYWDAPKGLPGRPYLLIPSNMGLANGVRKFKDVVRGDRAAGYYDRDPDMFRLRFGRISEEFKLMSYFVEAVQMLSTTSSEFDIVVRPHPVEDVDAWKAFLEGVPNVHVIREGSINAWIHNAFAVMHNGCTTAFESTISGKPVITYKPFEQEYELIEPNRLGTMVSNLDDLKNVVEEAFSKHIASQGEPASQDVLPEHLRDKILVDNERLASEKIVDVWEKVGEDLPENETDWKRYARMLRVRKAKSFLAGVAHAAFKGSQSGSGLNQKFPPLDAEDIEGRVSRLADILGMGSSLKCDVLSDRTVLIRRK